MKPNYNKYVLYNYVSTSARDTLYIHYRKHIKRRFCHGFKPLVNNPDIDYKLLKLAGIPQTDCVSYSYVAILGRAVWEGVLDTRYHLVNSDVKQLTDYLVSRGQTLLRRALIISNR